MTARTFAADDSGIADRMRAIADAEGRQSYVCRCAHDPLTDSMRPPATGSPVHPAPGGEENSG